VDAAAALLDLVDVAIAQGRTAAVAQGGGGVVGGKEYGTPEGGAGACGGD
jgi:hypothetical protein